MKRIFLTTADLKLPKSKSGFFLSKSGYFMSLLKCKNQECGSLNLTQSRILWIHGLTRFFNRNLKGVNTSAVYTDHPALRPLFNPRHGLSDRFYLACFVFDFLLVFFFFDEFRKLYSILCECFLV